MLKIIKSGKLEPFVVDDERRRWSTGHAERLALPSSLATDGNTIFTGHNDGTLQIWENDNNSENNDNFSPLFSIDPKRCFPEKTGDNRGLYYYDAEATVEMPLPFARHTYSYTGPQKVVPVTERALLPRCCSLKHLALTESNVVAGFDDGHVIGFDFNI